MSDTDYSTLSKLEDCLWSAADNLRANSKLTSSEYCMPVLGIIFLRHATNRYETALGQIEEDQRSGKMPKRSPIKADFLKRRAMMLPIEARYDTLLGLCKSKTLGTALIDAMEAIERDFEPLRNQLPKDYGKFESGVLENLLRVFDSEDLRAAGGDVFGRIYEYFLMKFAMQGAQDNGEFFTPPSLVRTIVNVIEPTHGNVFDPACGSGGMFVQSSHFIEESGQDTSHRVTFFGQEKTATTIRLAKMNLAVHGLEGDIREANTFYEDVHSLYNRCDYVMANPPFNVDKVDSEKVKNDRRLPFGLPGINKDKEVSNGNYLWISYFHSYLAPQGRAGFVMSSQASSAGHGEAEVRRKLVQTGDVDVMISIRSNFFYTRTVPCELWFFDKAKPASRRDTVLMLDARNTYRKVTRKIYDFSPEQLKNLTAIVWLYRGETQRFVSVAADYLNQFTNAGNDCFLFEGGDKPTEPLPDYLAVQEKLHVKLMAFVNTIGERTPYDGTIGQYIEAYENVCNSIKCFDLFRNDAVKHWNLTRYHTTTSTVTGLVDYQESIASDLVDQIHHLIKVLDLFQKNATGLIAICEEQLDAKTADLWDSRYILRAVKAVDDARHLAVERLRRVCYFERQAHWLLSRFPEGVYCDVPGLCRAVNRSEIEAADWSLTPGRYVGVAPAEVDEDFDFEQTLRDIHIELADLDAEAATLAQKIKKNFEGLEI